ncbi:MAG: hypothetical protein Q7I99_02880 [Acholeplasmataceae bacterium]|nr:hypothetical protein [Acholeplasmataceae bacterium]
MLNKSSDFSVFFTDNSVSFFELAPFIDRSRYGYMKLDAGIIENGYIKEPEALLNLMQLMFKNYGVKPRKITHIIHDQNVLIRDIKISREQLSKKTIEEYIKEQQGKTLLLPFSDSSISHVVRHEDENEIRVIAVIMDSNLLHDYNDVYDRLRAKEVKFEISSLPLYEQYLEKSEFKASRTMLVSIYEGMFSLQIVEEHIPIFNLIEEIDGGLEEYDMIIENFVERIANYYKYNMRKGKQEIENVVFFNFNPDLSITQLEIGLCKNLKNYKAKVCDFYVEDPMSKILPFECMLPYAFAKNRRNASPVKFDFKLDRVKQLNLYANYLMIAAFFIVSATLLIYIPYFSLNEEIKIEQNNVNALHNQLQVLIEETPTAPTFSIIQQNYSNAYQYLMSQEVDTKSFMLDLISELNSNVSLESYQIKSQSKEIVLVLRGNTQFDLFEYMIEVYETFGITANVEDDTRWISAEPTYKFNNPQQVEVTIRYA